jgi:hypothetical protein
MMVKLQGFGKPLSNILYITLAACCYGRGTVEKQQLGASDKK